MASTPQKELNGVLFVEEKNEKIDYSGSCTIDGKEYYINGWKKTSSGGKKYLSLSFKDKENVRLHKLFNSASPAAPDEDSPF